MARKADRVGVRRDQVDIYGRPIALDFYKNLIQDLPSWTDMPVWVGGTEQLLPENDDEPVTTPIKADIQYPDELLNDQYFFYRESPTEVDGLAKIRSIKGNTIVWNQLVNTLIGNQSTVTKSDDVYTATNETAQSYFGFSFRVSANSPTKSYKNHVYFVSLNVENVNLTNGREVSLAYGLGYNFGLTTGRKECITKAVYDQDSRFIYLNAQAGSGETFEENDSFSVSKPMIIDLTQMYGSTIADNFYNMEQRNQGSGVAFLKQYFMLPYYAYDPGRLLSFNGTGIKTVGFNQWDEEWEGGSYSPSTGEKIGNTSTIRCKNPIPAFPSTRYYSSDDVYNIFCYDGNHNYLGTAQYTTVTGGYIWTTLPNTSYITFRADSSYGTTYKNDICINIFDASRNGEYEPYITNTTDLPISTFFPTGMKSAGTVYDELLPDKAITRIGAVDLGSLDWNYVDVEGHLRFVGEILTNVKLPSGSVVANAVCAKYETVTEGQVYGNQKIGICITELGRAMVYDTTYSTAAAFKTAMSGIYLYYELATPVVQSTLVFE